VRRTETQFPVSPFAQPMARPLRHGKNLAGGKSFSLRKNGSQPIFLSTERERVGETFERRIFGKPIAGK